MNYTLDEKYEFIKQTLLQSESANPIEIAKTLMKKEFIGMHGP